MSDESVTLTVPEVAELLRVPEAHVRRLAAKGRIPARKLGGAGWRFLRAVVLRWMEEGEAASQKRRRR